jgi:hypothetical protein
MATPVRPEISIRNKYWIDKHRHYELKHFCLQYPSWKKAYADLSDLSISLSKLERESSTNIPGDPTAECVLKKAQYLERMKLVERMAKDADEDLYLYILKAVTEGLSFTYLKTRLNIPCGKDMYYDRYRKFFWLLSEARA